MAGVIDDHETTGVPGFACVCFLRFKRPVEQVCPYSAGRIDVLGMRWNSRKTSCSTVLAESVVYWLVCLSTVPVVARSYV